MIFAIAGALLLGLALVVTVVVTRITSAKTSSAPLNVKRIDAFTVNDPWRRHVQSALSARRRIGEVVAQTPKGPIKERLQDIAGDVDRVVAQVWGVAQEGHALSDANRQVNDAGVATKLGALQAQLDNSNEGTRESILRSIDSVKETAAASERIRERRDNASLRLKEMDVRLDELVARSAEVATAGVEAETIDTLRADMDALVVDLEGLRQGLDETRRTATA